MSSAKLFEIAKKSHCAIFSVLSQNQYIAARKVCIQAILSTDTALHFQNVKKAPARPRSEAMGFTLRWRMGMMGGRWWRGKRPSAKTPRGNAGATPATLDSSCPCFGCVGQTGRLPGCASRAPTGLSGVSRRGAWRRCRCSTR